MCFGLKYKRQVYKRKDSSIRENIIPPSQAEGYVLPCTLYIWRDLVNNQERQERIEYLNNLIKKTVVDLKTLEEKRDKSKAKDRLQTSAKALLKHDLTLKGDNWGWIPKSVFDAGISSRALGLLTMLAMNSNTLPISGEKRVVVRVKPTTILDWLGIENRGQIKTIRDLFSELENAGLIKVNDDEIELVFPPIGDAEGGFCKVYTGTYKRILEHSHGVVALNRLAVYVGIRSLLYEDKNGEGGTFWNVVFHHRSSAWIGEVVDLSESTVKKIIDWFIANDILAWNLIQNYNKYHNKVYYLSEFHHARSLVEAVCQELNSKKIMRVVA